VDFARDRSYAGGGSADARSDASHAHVLARGRARAISRIGCRPHGALLSAVRAPPFRREKYFFRAARRRESRVNECVKGASRNSHAR